MNTKTQYKNIETGNVVVVIHRENYGTKIQWLHVKYVQTGHVKGFTLERFNKMFRKIG